MDQSGRKSEKLSSLDPNQLNLFETPQEEQKRIEEVETEHTRTLV